MISVQGLTLESEGVDFEMDGAQDSPVSLIDCPEDKILTFLPSLSCDGPDACDVFQAVAQGNAPSDPALARWTILRL
jgi:hypothetical protein